MDEVNIVFPHQLFEYSPLPKNKYPFYLVEEFLFFKQYAFHKQKLAYHRATMKFYEHYLKSSGHEVIYIESGSALSDIRALIGHLEKQEMSTIHYIDPVDDWLKKRIQNACSKHSISCKEHKTASFLNKRDELHSFFKPGKKKFSQTSFYSWQRKKHQILLEENHKPVGGKWSFDKENRKKYPKSKTPPPVEFPESDEFHEEALQYVKQNFGTNPGELSHKPIYPANFRESRKWLQQFLEKRFEGFGPYEDAIVAGELFLHHSVLTPMLNTGLITPQEVIKKSLDYAAENDIPLNSTEGFIRQIIGWREFIRGMYEAKGVTQRTANYWNFTRNIPKSFYNATTGINPVDITIEKVLQTGYCHHIERLMVLGNFMVLCEFHPNQVYRWFMELFIDAYDWVMVPNVYGMSQFADGGLMATKPYISGSNYLMKMSDFPKGKWQEIWDALFWRFMHVHRDFFTQNPRLGMLIKSFDKMSAEKQGHLIDTANQYLSELDRR